jgi:hypothetical protein
MAKRFRKKPVVIEAMQFSGENGGDITAWATKYSTADTEPVEIGLGGYLIIHTLEGRMRVSPLDWVIKGVQGEFYPCKPDIFEATYEPAD